MSENQEKQPQQVRIAVLPAPEMKTLYTNAFQTNIAQGELLLTASVSRQEKDDKGPFLSLQPQAALAMTPDSARRLASALLQALQQYDEAVDTIRGSAQSLRAKLTTDRETANALQVVEQAYAKESVTAGQLERFLGDQPELASKPKMAPKNGKKVAVVGSGPSGITCAGELARNGFDVTVFEAFFTGGGVLVYGIPEFRLPKAVVKREIDGLEEMGVKFEYNSVVGRITDAEELFAEGFDAIYIATGAGLPKFLNVPGENLPNVFFANEYLTRVNLMKANRFPEYDTPTKHGKNVVVFGGGNVAMDAVRTAKRLGAERAIIAYRRTEDEMPARRAELHHAKAEGVEVMPLVAPLEFVKGEDGAVCAVRVQKMELGEPDASGRRRPVPIEGAVEEIPCDVAISAIGTNANPFAKMIGDIKLNKWGYIIADEDGRTSDPRIWAGGDIVTGAATVILAMGAGKTAAASITKALVG